MGKFDVPIEDDPILKTLRDDINEVREDITEIKKDVDYNYSRVYYKRRIVVKALEMASTMLGEIVKLLEFEPEPSTQTTNNGNIFTAD